MAAAKGNQYWKARSSHGRNHAYTPDQLWDEAEKYFERLTDQKAARLYDPVNKTHFLRPPSVLSLCVHLGIGEATWYHWKTNGDKDLLEVINYIETIMRAQQFDGAAVGVFKANIISRMIGLADKHEVTGKDGQPLNPDPKDADPDDVARRVAYVLERARRTGISSAGNVGSGSDGDDPVADRGPEVVSEQGSPD
ncbi:terminase small subunit [Hyphomonas sp. UBA4494]|jgi:hypothetical protein|uniref:terminase small subunit n=1 Tax=Hyphomonas sp. UBA4494 TaxID=1946631 RepID=UPI0025C10D36|nr:terminase small subunit [Hyphomonas sp. UBA4494]